MQPKRLVRSFKVEARILNYMVDELSDHKRMQGEQNFGFWHGY